MADPPFYMAGLLSGGALFANLGHEKSPALGEAITPGADFYVAEDGTTFYVAENGTDNYVPE